MKKLYIIKCQIFFIIFIFPVILFAQQISIKEEYETLKTYPFSDESPLPALAISNKTSPFYPYSWIDGYTDKPVNKKWKVITLENEFIIVKILPELGGKVMGAIEKSTGKEFVYINHVVKFRSIGVRGPWTSGGIEHNFGLDLGHAPWTSAPVDYDLLKNPDGSVTCVVGGLDLASRSEWRVKINLPRDKAYFETEALWFNPLPLNQAYLSWQNAAFKASNDLQFYFPGKFEIGHDGKVNPWPIDQQGRDLSFYKNNNFGDSKSYHVMGNTRNWFGGYWKDSSFGFGHWSSYSDAPGKKLWIWSLARNGAIWEDLLTDNDGQYIEAQSGGMFNQPGEKSGYNSPFTQLSHKPLYSETKTDYWFPVKETEGMVDANIYGTLNVLWTKDSVKIVISPLQYLKDSLVVLINGQKVFSDVVTLAPMITYKLPLFLHVKEKDVFSVNFGSEILSYSNINDSLFLRPLLSNGTIKDVGQGEIFFRMAEEQNAMRNFEKAMDLYKDCIKMEPTHPNALAKIAELYYRKGQYKKAAPFALKVLEFNTYDGYANYIFGNIQYRLNHLDVAAEAFSIASKTMEFRSASFAQMAGIELKRKNYDQALLYSKKSLDYNRLNLTAGAYLIAAHRKSGNTEQVQESLQALLDIDPLNQFAKFEKYLSQAGSDQDSNKFKEGVHNEFPFETYLELAINYLNIGMQEEAIQLLELSPFNPIVNYWLAYLYRNISTQKCGNYLLKAEKTSPDKIFPFRTETLEVLNWAEQQHHSWKTVYYSALIEWNNKNIEITKALFEKCHTEPDYAPFYITRGILFIEDQSRNTKVIQDYSKAILLDAQQWRGWHELNKFYELKGDFINQYNNAKKAFNKFTNNAIINIDYAKALLNVDKPEECIKVLNKTLVLPHEGAREGREIFEKAYLQLALDKLEKNKYKLAVESLNNSKLYPENLGSGKPFDPDYRLQNYLLAYCHLKLGNEQNVLANYKEISDYSIDNEKLSQSNDPIGDYVTLMIYKQNKNEKGAEKLISTLEHSRDSLYTWHIVNKRCSPVMRWALLKYKDEKASNTLKELEQEITGVAAITRFTLFLRGLKFIESNK